MGSVVVALVATWLIAYELGSDPVTWYLVGGVHAILVAGVLHIVNSAFLASEGEAIRHVRGALGEENTRDELLRARRRRLIWDWVDSISLERGDLDHVVVARHGVVVIDSKWRNQISAYDNREMVRAAQRARSRTEAVVRSVLGKDRGTHRARVPAFTVTPVVALWGAAQHEVPPDTVVDGVHVIAGRDLVGWLGALDGPAVDKEAAAHLLGRLARYRETTATSQRARAQPVGSVRPRLTEKMRPWGLVHR